MHSSKLHMYHMKMCGIFVCLSDLTILFIIKPTIFPVVGSAIYCNSSSSYAIYIHCDQFIPNLMQRHQENHNPLDNNLISEINSMCTISLLHPISYLVLISRSHNYYIKSNSTISPWLAPLRLILYSRFIIVQGIVIIINNN